MSSRVMMLVVLVVVALVALGACSSASAATLRLANIGYSRGDDVVAPAPPYTNGVGGATERGRGVGCGGRGSAVGVGRTVRMCKTTCKISSFCCLAHWVWLPLCPKNAVMALFWFRPGLPTVS